MENKILLTYIKDGKVGFDWFETVNDMEVSIVERGIKEEEILDKLYIHSCEDISLSFECKAYMEK